MFKCLNVYLQKLSKYTTNGINNINFNIQFNTSIRTFNVHQYFNKEIQCSINYFNKEIQCSINYFNKDCMFKSLIIKYSVFFILV